MATYTSGTYTLTGVALPITAETLANQTVTYSIGGAVDIFNIQSDAGSYTTINQTITLADTLNLTAAGGTITLGTGIAALDNISATLTSGGHLIVGTTFASLLGTGSITYGAGGGTVVVGTANAFLVSSLGSATVYGFTNSAARIDNASLKFSTITGYTVVGAGTGIQTVTVSDVGGGFSFNTSAAGLVDGIFTTANLNSGSLRFTADSTGGTVLSAVCFLGDTRIATPDGETAVQDLRPGDLVTTRRDGATVFQPVRWVGSGRMRNAHRLEDFPVRIRAGAFADAVPHRDLLVTPEHCLLVDGVLVPARMLVNGGSITIDTNIPDYNYFHVEMDAHAILVAEGLEAESYLDTGNRGNFVDNGVVGLRPDFTLDATHRSWANDAAAPLAVDRDTVEPIWRKLDARAASMGLGLGGNRTEVGSDIPVDLHLLTENGVRIEPSLFDGRTCAFVVPGDAGRVHLVSRTSRPSEAIGPFVDDRRDLGVLVGAIGVSEGRHRFASTMHLTGSALPGWHGPENQAAACRWTKGKAALPVDLSRTEGRPVFLDIEVISAGPRLALALAA